jgi:hypothetical protein
VARGEQRPQQLGQHRRARRSHIARDRSGVLCAQSHGHGGVRRVCFGLRRHMRAGGKAP